MNETETSHMAGSPRSWAFRFTLPQLLAIGAALLFYWVVLIKTAWLCDDAYITMRTVDNFVNGHGLGWNPGERVQAYTHPLWMFVLSFFYFITGSDYWALLIPSLLCSTGTVVLVAVAIPSSPLAGSIAVLALALSRAFTDYSSSGLENPLTHLLFAAAVCVFVRGGISTRQFGWLALIAALAAINRQDTILLFFPMLLLRWWQLPKLRASLVMALAFLPLAAWLLFSTLYYGFPFPNTAYAKLSTGVEKSDLIVQGILYWLFSVDQDPITPAVILAALLLPLFQSRKEVNGMVIGVALYLAYTIWVGGDFMGGRFLAAPFLAAVMALTIAPQRLKLTELLPLAAAVLLLGSISTNPTYAAGADYGEEGEGRSRAIFGSGVADERAYYYQRTALLKWPNEDQWPYVTSSRRNPPVEPSGIVIENNVGFMGYYGARQELHILDTYALCDPLLARLPAAPKWRIGHYRREIPEGYEKSLSEGKNLIADPDLATYYDKLRLIISGPVFDSKRIKETLKMNLGSYDHLVETYVSKTGRRTGEPNQ